MGSKWLNTRETFLLCLLGLTEILLIQSKVGLKSNDKKSMTFLYQFKSTEEKKDENIRYITLARGMFSSLATEDGRSITITSGFAFILYAR